ncbi:hypothetical protein IA69_19560 [Massilia sp. JS1662]|nr:hypothetical protein [Massilia sp. JS1662]KGF80198.1 hypothetical protein IA69_19560 [Massilia sp. JS1662]
MRARTIDTHISNIIDEHLKVLSSRIATTTYPDTYRTMLSFCARTNSLKAAMLDTLESGNAYAFKTLLRALCEHYLQFLQIWVRFTLEKSDVAAADHSRFCGARALQEGLDVLAVADPLVPATARQACRTLIEARYHNVVRSGSEAFAHRADQFRGSSIVEFLARDHAGISPDELPLLDRAIPTFALLAPLGRGGPYPDVDGLAPLELEAFRAPIDDAEFVVALPAIIFMFTALAISREYPEHADIAPTICALIERFGLESLEED